MPVYGSCDRSDGHDDTHTSNSTSTSASSQGNSSIRRETRSSPRVVVSPPLAKSAVVTILDHDHDHDHDSAASRRPLLDPSSPSTTGTSSTDMTLAEKLYAYDLTLAQLVFQRFGRQRGARIAWEVLSHTGDGILWFLMVLPVVTLLWVMGYLDNVAPSSRKLFISFYTCNLVDIIAIILMKIAFRRARPPHHQADGRFVGPDQHSFPSGHATRTWCLVGLFLHLCSHDETVIREFFHLSPAVMRVLVLIWALAISFSRIALGRHYPSDVAAGAAIGLFVLYPISGVLIRSLTAVKQA